MNGTTDYMEHKTLEYSFGAHNWCKFIGNSANIRK